MISLLLKLAVIEEISLQRKYKGASFKLIGKIKNTKTPFIIDFGIGDVVVPKAEKRKIPT
jgi:predicted aspartyl protease